MVELMGHVRHCGLVTEVERFGQKMMKLEIHKPDEIIEQLIGGAAIYRVTKVTEEFCRSQYAERKIEAIGYDHDEYECDDDDEEAEERAAIQEEDLEPEQNIADNEDSVGGLPF